MSDMTLIVFVDRLFTYIGSRDPQLLGEAMALPTTTVDLVHWMLWLAVFLLAP